MRRVREVFAGLHLTRAADRLDYGEPRFVTAGWLDERLVVFVWTLRGSARRIMEASQVSRDLEVMSGAPCFRGTGVPAENLFDYLEGASTLEEFLEDLPSITRETAISVLEAAGARLAQEATAA